jgi:hypothetical protein
MARVSTAGEKPTDFWTFEFSYKKGAAADAAIIRPTHTATMIFPHVVGYACSREPHQLGARPGAGWDPFHP